LDGLLYGFTICPLTPRAAAWRVLVGSTQFAVTALLRARGMAAMRVR